MTVDLKQYTLPEIFAAAIYASRVRDQGAALKVALTTLERLKDVREDRDDR